MYFFLNYSCLKTQMQFLFSLEIERKNSIASFSFALHLKN